MDWQLQHLRSSSIKVQKRSENSPSLSLISQPLPRRPESTHFSSSLIGLDLSETHLFQILPSLSRILLEHQAANVSLLLGTVPCSSLPTDSSSSSVGGMTHHPPAPSQSPLRLSPDSPTTGHPYAGQATVPTGGPCSPNTKPPTPNVAP